jgi:hypothetical protein
MFCNQCGHRNPDGSNFCSSCGSVLAQAEGEETTITFLPNEAGGEVAEDELTVSLDAVSDDNGLLVVKRGPNAGSKYALDADVVHVGRHPESEIFLDDITVSRRHAEFLREGHNFSVRDVGSLNGTYVNRERIEQSPLTHGDEVQIGKFKLVFVTGGDA